MLEVDPKKRLTAKECLAHEFFSEMAEDTGLIEDDEDGENLGDHIKNFQEKYKFNVKCLNQQKGKQGDETVDTMSIEFRQGGIHGNLDTFKDSMGGPSSKDQMVNSLHHVNSKGGNSTKGKEIKRESIYKAALMSQLKNSGLDEFSKMNESFDSQNSGDTSSDGETDNSNAPKKSRFGRG